MIKVLDPKNDIVFQKIFGMKEHRHILISFLNSILNLTGKNVIKDVEFEEKHLDVSLIASEKLSILDLHVTTETNMNVNVEIQLINQYNMIKRTIFYMSKMLLSQLKKGEDYSCLNRTVTINILNFNYLEDENFIKRYGLFEKESKKSLTDLLEYIFIELPKFSEANKDYNNKLHKWLTFLSNPNGREIEAFMKTDGEIKEAMDVLYKISGDKEAIMLAEMREKAIMDEQSRLNGARKEGIEKEKENSRLRDADRVLKLLTKKLGTLEDIFTEKIRNMDSDNLNLIIENILDIESFEDIEKYLSI
ncbi:Rpn family recombination-promoting nuclease/putative transposase [Clostridium saccharoperbutylacetonicum]